MPASAHARAMPGPMPLSPPVMKATFPSTSFMGAVTEGHLDGLSDGVAAPARPGDNKDAEAPAAASAVPSRKRRRDWPDRVSTGFGALSRVVMSGPPGVVGWC